MIIGIDAREIQDGVVTGIGRALNNYLNYFGSLDDEHRCVLFSERAVAETYGPRVMAVVAPPQRLTMLWDQAVLPRLMKKHHIDLFFSPYYKIPVATRVPIISTIFDLMYIYYPMKWKGTGPFSKLYYRMFGGIMAAKAHTIFTCSEYSKTEILKFYGVPAAKVAVILLGLSDRYRRLEGTDAVPAVKRKFSINGAYILYTGNFKPHKNAATLIEAFERIRESVPGLQLVLAGNRDGYFEPIDRRIQASAFREAIVATGLVDIETQVALYNGASAFVFPSLYEGFGYPPLEAMACGVPVVSSACTSLDEIIGDAAVRCDPRSAVDIAEKTIGVLRDEALRRQCITRGFARAREFTNEQFCGRLHTLLFSRR